MIAVDRDPAKNIKLVTDPPKGLAQFAKHGSIQLQGGPKKTPGKIELPIR